MKIKNLQINQRAAAKLGAVVLAGSLAIGGLTGCASKDNLLDGTILEGARVVFFQNGKVDIATAIGRCNESEYSHYHSIISGVYFSSEGCQQIYINTCVNAHYPIIDEESISYYLTTEDLKKASEGTLNQEDILEIIERIRNSVGQSNVPTR